MTTVTKYTICPTFEDTTEDDIVLESTEDLEARAIGWCRANHMHGAHVFAGDRGPVIGPDAYEDNYCGWIDT